MECNKEEAIRAKEIAEKKMQNNDFEGARKIALKAQQLFPDLENISQLLTVCDVHCSAQKKIYGSDMDWYGILQIERVADEATIKKQYRKLALLLHPDKNKFAGAEAAFKLIGEANRVLSDKGKRSLYDIKCRASLRTAAPKPPPHQVNRNAFVRKPYGVQNNFPNVANSQFTGLNPHQPTQPGFSNGQQTFWTCCPFCSIRYQYYRDIVNRALRCQSCSKSFIAYDLGAQGAPPVTNWSQPAFPQPNQVPKQGAFNVGSQSTGGIPHSHTGFRGGVSWKTMESEPVSKTGSTAEVGVGSKTKGKEDGHLDVGGGKEGVGMPKFDAAKPRESGTSRNTSRKRGRKLVVESSESCETSSSADTDEDVVIQQNGSNPTGQNFGLNGSHHPRRSSRQKQHVSYNENVSDDDDFVSPPKRSRGGGSSSASVEKVKEEALDGGVSKTDNSAGFAAAVDGDKEEVKQKGSAPLKESLLNINKEAGKCKVNVKEAATVDHGDEKSKVGDDSGSNSNADSAPDPECFEYPDPDFSDFDKDKKEDCFAVDQIWAIYDTTDGMPRFYARVRKVFSPVFKLRITWLEPHLHKNEGLPVACGKFKHGNSEETIDLPMFSHQVHCEKGSGRCSFVIYPRKGETWALFKNWDVRWSSVPENYRKCKLEFVEVVSDFAEDAGIRVAYLDKVKGFVSLFRQTAGEGIVSFQIPPSELLRFSHRIPSYRMTGTEREGVPEGSFELDPASLPADLDKFSCSSDVKVETESMDAKVNGSCPKTPENKVKPVMGSERINTPKKSDLNEFACPGDVKVETESMDAKVNGSCPKTPENKVKPVMGSERINTPKKSVDLQEKTDLERETSKLRRSPRQLSSTRQKQSQVNASQCTNHEETGEQLDGTKDKRHGDLTQDEKIHSPMKDRNPDSVTKNPSVCPPISSGHKVPEADFYNFNGEKSEEKFQPGQIWALYRDGLPKNYGQVKKIESSPDFRLHVALLEACMAPKDIMQPAVCGTFKLKNSKLKALPLTAFSHMLKAESVGKNKFEIYPRKGEVWALYKNWNAELTSSDLQNCRYDIVEVLEVNDHGTKVLTLVCLHGFKSVFKPPRRQRSNTGVMEIPRAELPRFSHQIPAVRHTEEKDGRLRGCWELDPASLPVPGASAQKRSM